jgi:MFS family permease
MYSIATVIGGVLVFAGLGSKFSERLGKNSTLSIGISIIVFMVLFIIIFAPSIINYFLGYSIIYRIIITILLIAPLSFSIGFFFPVGLRIIGEKANAFVPWAWGINSGATVIGSIISIIFAMFVGFNITFLISVMIYIVGYISIMIYT